MIWDNDYYTLGETLMAVQHDWREISGAYTDEPISALTPIWACAFPDVNSLTVEQYHALIYLVGEAGTTYAQAAQQIGMLVNKASDEVHTHVLYVESAAFNLGEATIEAIDSRLQDCGYYDWMDTQLTASDDA